ncbi:hypothetical protein HRR83_003607 [Exophiala dermatitidis]|uniref:Integral membrane protein n=2 Tax=Exophiala dermatitidis TaxID=5970 RepID=H6BSP8_EXODN|nr:uncharacterized protein HMPREF1120_01594 [Exophiala dermatitidis NIH/UT8656]KAJ4519082.1 hypothetical protein HRR75_002760 [Exophiala dermatitidis]EHY53400.1 hypothetical protein HMPREF1120_01594 [Exophiala dermatitidis NIH/UT8656]KAJ4522428.1 hypothetical protein HRR74_003013 [Exophiala dermatitidis]KAJ4529753.1 hypothetical protein HRR73_000781 [Exophiala dermatitidis]KAJ4543080.1 hypothetical protein HRR77_005340 [Exophiala dermatitidis]
MEAASRVDITSLKPIVRAYALGYVTVTGPRLLDFLRTLRKQDRSAPANVALVFAILKTSTQINRFPTAAAITVGGATLLPRLAEGFLQWLVTIITKNKHIRLNSGHYARLRFLCSFLSAWLAFDLLNRDEAWARKQANSVSAATADVSKAGLPNQHHLPPPSYHLRYAGKTIDFTLFAFCRALDIAVITAWTRTRSKPWHPEQRYPAMARLIRNAVDPWIFATSAAIIMWSWFYSPHRLPRAYNSWISKAADIDGRLIQALRLARQGDFVYGRDTGQAPLLAGLCRELGLPEVYGDPAKTIPIPCELYHCGTGKSCEVHGISRFWRSWKFAMEVYVPLQVLSRMRSPSKQSALAGLISATRSSSFLAAFVALFYYSVCLARTRLGPRLFSYKTVTPQMWDSGLCVLAGCLACGWSILLERPSRRQEIAFFVAPRAMATVLPRVYDRRYIRREQAVFATSVALVLTTLQTGNRSSVRGVLGRILGGILKE